MTKAAGKMGCLYFVLFSSIPSQQTGYTDGLFCNSPDLKWKMKQTLQNVLTKFQVTID
jgi:hypothetical protein